MRVLKSVPVEDFELRGSIKDSDVTRLKRAFAEDPQIHENEAETLLRLNRSCPIHAPSWSGFLADAIADYILNQSGPEGYITIEKSRWLVARLATDGWIANRAEFDLLVAVLGKARWFPLSLATFALEQVAGAVIHGFGPLRRVPGPLALQGAVPGTIGEPEIALIRTILNAFGGDSALPLTRPEAEILLDINRAVAGRLPPPAWTDLFAKAVANVVLAEHGYAVPPRAVALTPGAVAQPAATVGEQVTRSLGQLRRDYHTQSCEERALARLERQRIEIVTGEEVAAEEAGWLTDRLLSSLRPSAIEAAVLAHLDRECLIGEPGRRLGIGRGGYAA
ncbi:hypothetical protein [Hyphomicrobium sp.]|uniref:hypothetical protein n=1 Tax=Hyphomicrobium sp. TaxID=82 RepID=UPI0025B9BDAF|nr:hypothetical protein [Hyphomicrobium sp.]MCC7252528.1 hypothetical protein [Hyphomicrobium sp.]